jgi:hypothetical protein
MEIVWILVGVLALVLVVSVLTAWIDRHRRPPRQGD